MTKIIFDIKLCEGELIPLKTLNKKNLYFFLKEMNSKTKNVFQYGWGTKEKMELKGQIKDICTFCVCFTVYGFNTHK